MSLVPKAKVERVKVKERTSNHVYHSPFAFGLFPFALFDSPTGALVPTSTEKAGCSDERFQR